MKFRMDDEGWRISSFHIWDVQISATFFRTAPMRCRCDSKQQLQTKLIGSRPCSTAASQILTSRPCSTSYENNSKSQVAHLAMKAGCLALPENVFFRHVSSPKMYSRNVCSPPLKHDGQAVQHYQCRWMQPRR